MKNRQRLVCIAFAEIGLMGAIFKHLQKDLLKMQAGREKKNLLNLQMELASAQQRLKKANLPSFFALHKEEITFCIHKISNKCTMKITPETGPEIVVSFCLAFLKESPSKFPSDIYKNLNNLQEYYSNGDDCKYSELFSDIDFASFYSDLQNEVVDVKGN